MVYVGIVTREKANFSFEPIGLARVVGEQQQWLVYSIRKFDGSERSAGADQASPATLFAGHWQVRFGRN